jgi:membrane fusion protein, multidrug efflux system
MLRHGQTGTVLIHHTLSNALVIPQRAVFEILEKRYVFVLDKDDVAHQRLITIDHELEDIFVLKKGLTVNDKIVLEGVREIKDGKKVEYEFRSPEEALANQKNHAE